jgi:hypothetical protein
MAASIHSIPELDRKGLREFGLMTGGLVAGLFGLFFPWLLETGLSLWPWLVAGTLAAWALIAPASLRPVYRAWMRLALWLGRITTPIILGVVFFLVISPVALVMKLISRDAMARRFDENAKSYRVPSCQAPREHMEKPY